MYLVVPDPENDKPLLAKVDLERGVVRLQSRGRPCEIDMVRREVRYYLRDGTRPYQTLDMDVLREEKLRQAG